MMRTHFIALFASLSLLLMGPYALANDAYEAWEDKRYDEALQGFLDQQMESPNNRDLGMNVGSAHYMLGDFDKAANQFELLTQNGTPQERSEAFYNLGNTKYRQGKLDEALQAYQKTLELNPDDKEANYNLEFVRDEIRRRHEEAQKNQDQQQQQQQQQQDQQQNQDGQENNQDEPQNSMSDDPEHQRQGDEPDAPQEANPPEDGATDQPEGQAEPQQGDEPQPDQEGQDGNAAAEQEQNDTTQEQDGQAQEGQSGESDAPTGQEQALTPEEAQRYLDALDPDRPPTRKRARKGRRSRKDW